MFDGGVVERGAGRAGAGEPSATVARALGLAEIRAVIAGTTSADEALPAPRGAHAPVRAPPGDVDAPHPGIELLDPGRRGGTWNDSAGAPRSPRHRARARVPRRRSAPTPSSRSCPTTRARRWASSCRSASAIAAIVFWILLRPRVTRAEVLPGLLLGLAYCGQASFYFWAVSIQDASVTSVFQAVTPPIVAVAAVLLGRERASPACSSRSASRASAWCWWGSTGGDSSGHVVPLGALLAIASSAWYAGYLLAGERIVKNDQAAGARLPDRDRRRRSASPRAASRSGSSSSSSAAGRGSGSRCRALMSTVFAVTAIMAGHESHRPVGGGPADHVRDAGDDRRTRRSCSASRCRRGSGWGPRSCSAVVAVQLPGRRAATVPAG